MKTMIYDTTYKWNPSDMLCNYQIGFGSTISSHKKYCKQQDKLHFDVCRANISVQFNLLLSYNIYYLL